METPLIPNTLGTDSQLDRIEAQVVALRALVISSMKGVVECEAKLDQLLEALADEQEDEEGTVELRTLDGQVVQIGKGNDFL